MSVKNYFKPKYLEGFGSNSKTHHMLEYDFSGQGMFFGESQNQITFEWLVFWRTFEYEKSLKWSSLGFFCIDKTFQNSKDFTWWQSDGLIKNKILEVPFEP